MQLTITADFEERMIRYSYEQVNDKSAGVPEGGILSMRECPEAEWFESFGLCTHSSRVLACGYGRSTVG